MNNLFIVSIVSLLLFTGCKKEVAIVPDSISFTNDTKDQPVKELTPIQLTSYAADNCAYLWNFGNGRASTEKNPVIVYKMHGTYTITMEVIYPDGVAYKSSKQVTILCLYKNHDHHGELL